MTVIVTGSEGFIGKALVSALLKRNVNVIKVDRKIGIEAAPFFEQADLSEIDVVYHLAAQTSVFNENKDDIIHDNITTFKTVCDACAKANVRFIYASSSTANPGNTSSLYGISKRFDEEYAKHYYRDATGVRFHNVYGPDPRQGTLLWCLLNQKGVELYNGGMNKRHFTFIDDVVDGLIALEKIYLPLVNIASPYCYETKEFAFILGLSYDIDYKLVGKIRKNDNFTQKVNDEIFTLPLRYTKLDKGLEMVYNREKGSAGTSDESDSPMKRKLKALGKQI